MLKIKILEINKNLQPNKSPFNYPQYNSDYGVEQDFLNYLLNNPVLLTDKIEDADWYYLPIFWTRWYLNNGYGSSNNQVIETEIKKIKVDKKRVFTVCQYDNGPISDTEEILLFLASQGTAKGITIPLLSDVIEYKNIDKIYLASFLGRISTHPLRKIMREKLEGFSDVIIKDGNYGVSVFADTMAKSKISLAPRGFGGSSFRFFEAMQFGSVPLLIGNVDSRPFKKYIDWDSCSFYLEDVEQIDVFIKNINVEKLPLMAEQAIKIRQQLDYQKWCNFVIKELENYEV